MYAAERYLEPLDERLHQELIKHDILHSDETAVHRGDGQGERAPTVRVFPLSFRETLEPRERGPRRAASVVTFSA